MTRETTETFINVVETLRKWNEQEDPQKLAHFVIQLLFSLVAEDLGILPNNIFTQMVEHKNGKFEVDLKDLFGVMQQGGRFGYHEIPYIDGTLFSVNFPSQHGFIRSHMTVTHGM